MSHNREQSERFCTAGRAVPGTQFAEYISTGQMIHPKEDSYEPQTPALNIHHHRSHPGRRAGRSAGISEGQAEGRKRFESSNYHLGSRGSLTSGIGPRALPLPKPGQRDSKPGVAWKTAGGTVKEIRGETYTVEDYDGRQMTVHFGQGTKHLRGDKKVGDHIRAEITHGGFANSIQ